uniref:Ovule protein n=1 Tax=Strongyloides venezuelensis TaxID=75913 RepID=A0A0K0FFX1_STRVS
MSELSSLLSDNSSVSETTENDQTRIEERINNDNEMKMEVPEAPVPQEDVVMMEAQEDNFPEKSKVKLLLESFRDDPLKETRLGIAVEDLLVHYHGLLASFGVSYHNQTFTNNDLPLKETAEIISKQVKDAALDVQSEFNKAFLQWKLTCPEEAEADELEDITKAIGRQRMLLDKCEDKLGSRHNKPKEEKNF